MNAGAQSNLVKIVQGCLGNEAAADVLDILEIDPALIASACEPIPASVMAMALNVVLFRDLVNRVPTAQAYVADVRAAGERVCFDHGAVRSIDFGTGPTGQLPAGYLAVSRLLEPLGYREADIYPLERLRMTGRAYRHETFPAAIPQFFVSALHVDRFSPAFQEAAHHVFDETVDPIGADNKARLDSVAHSGALPLEDAVPLINAIAGFFARHHPAPRLADYEALLAESAEAAWMATEGNAFNHATDRVPDLEKLVAGQKALGRPMKAEIERSASGRINQTAFRADTVERSFINDIGLEITRSVPGSFYEFIERAKQDDGSLDLRFDSSNAQGIFKMTAVA